MGQAKSKSKPVWNIKQDNWLDKVNNVVKEEGNLDDQTKAFVPIWPSPDPASGCQKEFTSAYQCAPGTSQKEVIIPASADGHTATYDCSQEFIQCARGVLEILDNGEPLPKNEFNPFLYLGVLAHMIKILKCFPDDIEYFLVNLFIIS